MYIDYNPNYIDGVVSGINEYSIIIDIENASQMFDKTSYKDEPELKIGQHVVICHKWVRVCTSPGKYFDREVYEIYDKKAYVRKKESK